MNENTREDNSPTVWDKIHAIGICVLGVAAVVMVGNTLIEKVFSTAALPAAQSAEPKTVNVLSPYGLPPVQTIDGKAVSCAAPATYEDLAQAFVCVCKAPKHPPIGSGVLVGAKESSGLKVYLLTARHVAEACIAANGKDSVTFIVHRPNETNDFRKTYHGEDVRWGFATTGSDLAVVDVTAPFKTLRQEGVDVRYVFLQHTPLPVDDQAAVQGGFVIKRCDFDKYHLGIVTEVGVFGSASEIWESMLYKGRQPLGFRTGRVAIRNDALPRRARGGAPIYIIEADTHPGYSGGPVFANFKINGLDYPALIGVVKGSLGKRSEEVTAVDGSKRTEVFKGSGFATVAPIDDLIERH